MIKRRTLVGLIIVAAVLAVVVLLRMIRSKPAAEGELATDVAVHIGKITRVTLHRYVTAYGSVEPEPAGQGKPPAGAQVASPVSGIISQISCTEGQRVAKGTVLFELDRRVAEVALQGAKHALAFAEQNFERQQKLLPEEGTSKRAYQEAEQQLNAARTELAAAQTQLALLRIEAPLAGILTKVNVKLGEAVELNKVLAEIIDLNRLVVAADVPSREAPLLKPGQPVELNVRQNEVIKGTLYFISRQINPQTDTVPIRISLPAPANLEPGQFLSLRVVCEEHRDSLVVPEESVVTDAAGGSMIWLVEGDRAVSRPVKTGLRESGLVEIEGEGLKEGTVIVTEEAYSIPQETKIHIINP
jgi:membrane fusion protein (multidrug efflux system)